MGDMDAVRIAHDFNAMLMNGGAPVEAGALHVQSIRIEEGVIRMELESGVVPIGLHFDAILVESGPKWRRYTRCDVADSVHRGGRVTIYLNYGLESNR